MNGTRNPKPIDLTTVDLQLVEARIDRSNARGCWIWTGSIGLNGYGKVSRGRSMTSLLAHRVVYTMHRGPIPEGKILDHLCRNRGCVNPAHLEPVTIAINNARGYGASGIHGRQTHCVRGHELAGGNLYVTKTGGRKCRECARQSDKRRMSGWARQRAAAEGKK